MASSIKLDANCDIVFDNNGVCEIVEDIEDIAQAIRVELEQNKGQWAINALYGTPYLNKENTGLLQEKNNPERIKAEIRKVINKYNGAKLQEIEITENEIVAKIKIKGEVVEI